MPLTLLRYLDEVNGTYLLIAYEVRAIKFQAVTLRARQTKRPHWHFSVCHMVFAVS
jgi:hypothetical protein